jgi:hypothetical protein
MKIIYPIKIIATGKCSGVPRDSRHILMSRSTIWSWDRGEPRDYSSDSDASSESRKYILITHHFDVKYI